MANVPQDGEVFTIALAGAKLKPEQIKRINASLQAAVMGELASADVHGEVKISPVLGGKTAGGTSIATAAEFDDYCGTGWPKKFREKIFGGRGPGRGPIINGIIIDRIHVPTIHP